MKTHLRRKQISQEIRESENTRLSKSRLNVALMSPERLNQPKIDVDMKDLEVKIKEIAK